MKVSAFYSHNILLNIVNGLQLKYSVVLLKYFQIQIPCKNLVLFLFSLVNLFVYNKSFQVEITRLRIYLKK